MSTSLQPVSDATAIAKHVHCQKQWPLFSLKPTEKLSVDVKTVEHGVEGLMYLLTECSKLLVSLNKAWQSLGHEC